MARPKIEIDPKQVRDLASVGCKVNEIAILLECSPDTLERRFAGELKKGKETLRMSLRRWQIEAARKGNPALLIWLGKQLLGQTDKIETKNENINTDKLTIYLGGDDGKQKASAKNSEPLSKEESL